MHALTSQNTFVDLRQWFEKLGCGVYLFFPFLKLKQNL